MRHRVAVRAGGMWTLDPWRAIWTRHRRLSGIGNWGRVLERLLTHTDMTGIADWAVLADST